MLITVVLVLDFVLTKKDKTEAGDRLYKMGEIYHYSNERIIFRFGAVHDRLAIVKFFVICCKYLKLE